jgi:hypothetical protein
MSGRYAYCVAPAGHRPPAGLRGIDDAPVTQLEVAGVSVWVSPMAARPAPAVERIRRHNAVIEAATAPDLTPVPIRFGQWLHDADSLARHAAERAGEWLEWLQRHAGTCELGARIVVAEEAAARSDAPMPGTLADPGLAAAREMQQAQVRPGSPGRAHMQRLAAQHATRTRRSARSLEVLEELRRRLGGCVLAERVETLGNGGISAAHLVRRAEADRYLSVAEAASRSYDDVTVTITGPWPPYSFAE